jgi:uncharacterized protein
MYYPIIRQFVRTLKNLDAVLGKAQQHAQARKFDVNNFMTARMAPDMLPFVAQVRIACDHAKSAASGVAGKEAPRHEDNETTFEELHGRIAKCVAYLETLTARDFERTTPDMVIKMPRSPGKGLRVDEYLLARQVPNFFFHVTTAYDLLRAGGVEIGKSDFIGTLELVDAP